jgi:hypothetical protein
MAGERRGASTVDILVNGKLLDTEEVISICNARGEGEGIGFYSSLD